MESSELRPTQMVVGGAALAREDSGRVVFISGAIAGETVTALFTAEKKDFATAEVESVVVGSPLRVEPPCEAWQRGCGGCDWQHIEPSGQLGLKVDIVREALTRTGRLVDPVVVAGASVEPWGYRTTVRLAASPDGRPGFRARRSHDVVPIDSCPVADPAINGLIRSLHLDRDAEVTLRVGLARGDNSLGVRGAIVERVGDHDFRVSNDSFFQSSPRAAALLVDAVSRAVADLDLSMMTVIDAYGGVGLFAATVANHAARVVLVESSSSSCADARVNLSADRATVVECRLEDWQPVRADLVIADPARSGLGRIAADRLAATRASRIVLVSCDAASLARDARLLVALNYLHRGTEVIDVFPNTSHVEAVTRFDLNEQQMGTVDT